MAVRKHGKGWQYRFQFPNPATGIREWQSKAGFRTKKEAVAAEAERRRELETGVPTRPEDITVGDYIDQWLAYKSAETRAGTVDAYRTQLARVARHLGAVPLTSLTVPQMRAFRGTLLTEGKMNGGPLAPQSAANTWHTWKTLLETAVSDGYLRINPTRGIKANHVPERTNAVWEPDMVAEFFNFIEYHPLRAAFVLTFATGSRREGIAGLPWSQFSADTGKLLIRQCLTGDGRNARFEPVPKRGKGYTVQLSAPTVAVIKEHQERQELYREAADELWQPSVTHPAVEGWEDLDLMFRDELGGIIMPKTYSNEFDKAQETFRGNRAIPRITYHGIRHTYASIALKARVPVKVVSERLGHSNIRVTLETYSHLLEGMDGEAAEEVAALLFKPRVETPGGNDQPTSDTL